MKRKVKKFAQGEMVTSRGGDTNISRRSADEIAADNKAGYGRYMPKTKEYTLDEAKEKLSGLFGGKSKAKEEAAPAEDRPRAKSSFGYEDMDGRMPAKSTMSGPIEDIKPEKAEPKAEASKAKEEAKPSSVDFSKYDTESYTKPTSTSSGSTSTTGGSKSSKASDSKSSKASDSKPKKAKFPSNPDAPKYDTSGNERRRGDSQSFAPPPRSGIPKNTFLTKERSDAAKKSMSKGFSMGLFERGDLGIGKKQGGSVKSASARADGCAIRGKTRA